MDSPFYFTKVTASADLPNISYRQPVYMSGSCFSEHVATYMKRLKFNVLSNAHGILFNPVSLAESLGDLLSEKRYQQEDLVQTGELWASFRHHGVFNHTNPMQVLDKINQTLEEHRAFFAGAKVLCITFGTAFVFQELASGKIVANCHKLPGDRFRAYRLSITEITATWKTVLLRCLEAHPDLSVIFTVSPVKHIREGLQENQLSKATLLLAIRELTEIFPQVFYYPSYEIMVDELRDYRFYAEDGAHPNAQAVHYISQRFLEDLLMPAELSMYNEIRQMQAWMEHRPLHPESKAYKEYHHTCKEKLKALAIAYPFLNWEKEIHSFTGLSET